ncbi:MAG TPA: polyamine aminopropyltransferase [Patescibacteria group bacterium]|nr:polyamine aminopropyltransferase [Patescibacteria group bacterium]
MALEKIKNEIWFREELFPDVAQSIKVSKVLFHKTTKDKKGKKLQELLILDTPRFGKILTLDGSVQLTEADEKYYHEPLAHCSLFSHPNPKNVLIIGGGDGGLLREVVKHPVNSITLVDIDREAIELTKKYMPDLAGDSWDDKRLKIYIEDGAIFVKKTKKKYDLVILDTPDPIGPALSLFKTTFYLDCKKILAPGGIIIRQTGSSILQPEEMPSNFRQMEELFPEVKVLLTAVPTYIGGYFTFVVASDKKGIFEKAFLQLGKRFKKLKLKTEWYTPKMHKASLILPRELENSLKKTEYGVELIIDLYDCDYSVITSRKKLYQFAKDLCEVLKMKPYGEPIIPDFGFALSKTAGFSLVQLIESSSITAHYSPYWKIVCLNIFTCKSFDIGKAFQFVKNFFGADRAVAFILKRGGRVFRKDLEIINISTSK